MVIDFHAHIYPQKIAVKASGNIGKFYNVPMCYDGSPEQLIKSGSKIGVSKYIVHSTATAARQVESINNYIISEVNAHGEFVGFGTVHPDYEDFEGELRRIKSAGLRGVKLHPDFQQFEVDTPTMDPVYETIAALKMPVLVHAGDFRYDFSGPKRIRNVVEKHATFDKQKRHHEDGLRGHCQRRKHGFENGRGGDNARIILRTWKTVSTRNFSTISAAPR